MVGKDTDSDTKLQATLLEKPKYLTQDKDNIYQAVKVLITDSHDTTQATANVGSFTVNFPTSSSDAAFKGSTATATINWDKIGDSAFTSVGAVTIGTKTFRVASGDYTNLSTLRSKVKTWYADSANVITGYSYNEGVFTANNIGTTYNTTAFTTGNNSDIVNYKPAVDQEFKVNGVPFTYSTTLTGAQNYKDLDSLKTAVNNWFTTHAVAGYNYSNGVFTFTGGAIAAALLTGNEITDAVTFNAYNSGTFVSNGKTRTVTYIQKISKAQGDNKDDALLPKNVASYEVSKNFYDCGDGDDASDRFDDATSFTVAKDGILYAIKNTGTNVKLTALKLMKDKVKFDYTNSLAPTNFTGKDDKVDVYLAEKGEDGDTDIDQGEKSASVDVNGDVWAVHEGKIMKFEKSDFVTKFTTDRSLDELDVYDEGSLVAWEKSGGVYTNVNEGTAVTAGDAKVVAPVVVTGWVQGTDGTWTFNDITGTKVVSKWINPGGVWYYLKQDGIMATGWYQDGSTWYYLNPTSGAMATGWFNDNGTWYYLNSSGAMLKNTTVDGYVLGSTGAWIQ